MRNTTDASTAFGMYDSGTVRNSRTTTTMTPVVSCDDLAPATGAVDHLGLGRAAVDDEGAREPGREVADAEPDEVDVLVEAVVVLHRVGARRRGALGEDEDEHREHDRQQGADVAQQSIRRCRQADAAAGRWAPRRSSVTPRAAKSKT